MNLFKKALVASAVVASFGVAAEATVSSTPLALSSEGVAAGNSAANASVVFDVVVGTLHPAASTITLTFDSTVDLNGLVGGAVTNTPANGTGVVAGTAGKGAVGFDYGTGSFTFDNVVVDDNDQTKGEQDTISFDINLGNPLTANSAFRIYLGDIATDLGGTPAVDVVDITGAASVAYSSETSGGDAIETGTGVIATEESQFSFAVKTALDAVIEREDMTDFLPEGTGDLTDSLVFVFSNDETLGAALANPTLDLAVSGDFTGLEADANVDTNNDDEVTIATAATGGAAALAAAEAVTNSGDEDELTATIANVNLSQTSTVNELTLAFTHDGTGDIAATGDVMTTATVDSVDLADPIAIATNVASGSWEVDATIINVPYFPVGFEGTSTSVHFANEGATDVDVIVSAIDADGNTYGPLPYGMDFAGDTVTKVSQGAIMSLFDITESAKLSVTFNLDANEGVVNAYAFTTDDTGRTEISNSQLKGK
jgi:hypothetical protein